MNLFQKIKTFAVAHKIWSVIIVIVIVGGVYYSAKAAKSGVTTTTYTLATAAKGTVITTVTGTGQVSANNQADVDTQVSGTVSAINVSVGQAVTAGQSLAHIDSPSALQSLQSAQIAYSKLTEPATEADTSNAEDTLAKSYTDAYNNVTSALADMTTIKNGLNNELYQSSGFLSTTGANADTIHTVPTAANYWSAADQAYNKAYLLYTKNYTDFQSVSLNAPTSTIANILNETYITAQAMATAVNDANAVATFITSQDTTGKTSSTETAAESSFATWVSTANGDVSSLLAAQDSITSAENALNTLTEGPQTLDVESQQISLTQAQQNYDYTYVRAPFDGVVAKIDVTPAQVVSSGTTVATIITPNEYATISLNEVDAAKISVGQKATLTFDAINDLTIAGTVSEIDGIGAVTQGVVTYGVKIAFDSNDARVKPGMSVNASIITAADQGVVVVPSAAVKTQGSTSYVQELSQKYSAAQATAGVTSLTAPKNVPVTVGLSDNTNTEIVTGVAVGDQVVIRTAVVGGSAAATKSTAAAATTRSGFGGGAGGGAGGVLRGL
jgi:RND family efflux transporter MFP subunit